MPVSFIDPGHSHSMPSLFSIHALVLRVTDQALVYMCMQRNVNIVNGNIGNQIYNSARNIVCHVWRNHNNLSLSFQVERYLVEDPTK